MRAVVMVVSTVAMVVCLVRDGGMVRGVGMDRMDCGYVVLVVVVLMAMVVDAVTVRIMVTTVVMAMGGSKDTLWVEGTWRTNRSCTTPSSPISSTWILSTAPWGTKKRGDRAPQARLEKKSPFAILKKGMLSLTSEKILGLNTEHTRQSTRWSQWPSPLLGYTDSFN